MRTRRRIRSLSLVSILVLLVTTLIPVSPAFAAITWNTKAPLPEPRSGSGIGVLNGKVYVIGGQNSTGNPTSSLYEYDPATNAWATKASMPLPYYTAAATAVGNKLYVVGGTNGGFTNTVREYDPNTNSWTTKAPMPTGRDTEVVEVNGKIYAIGGWSGWGSGEWRNQVEIYDPGTDTWTTKSPMPTLRAKHGLAVANGKIYAIGGWDSSSYGISTVEEYNPASDTWTPKAPLPTPRADLAVAVVNDKIYAIGGNIYAGFATVEKYDPITNTWTTETSMSTARGELAAAVVNNKIYAIGGVQNQSGYLATNEEGIVPEGQEKVQVQGTVDPTIELVINPTTLSFGNVNPSVGSYTQTKTATVKSNKNWQLLVRKVSDLTGANTNWVIPSSQLTFTSPLQTNAQFQTTDTLVNSGNPTASTVTNITYNLTVSWLDPPDSYSAEHTYTAIQP